MRTLLGLVFVCCFSLQPARAATPQQVDALVDVLRLGEMAQIMSQEGSAYGVSLEDQMFPGRGGDRWAAIVARIYDAERMVSVMRRELGAALSEVDLAGMVAFFTADPAATIIGLEISARRALLQDEVEEAARARSAELLADPSERLELIDRFVAANNLIDFNVAGGMNANYEFYRGLALGGAVDNAPVEGEMLNQIMGQEAEMRADTTEWLYSYLVLAYDPVALSDLETYIAYSETADGQRLNSALFQGYDVLFRAISRDLGVGVAQYLKLGEDL